VKLSQYIFPPISVVCAAAWLAPSYSSAQVVASADLAENAPSEVAEVVVTAQKRSENLREVPQSISVLTGAQLAQQHVDAYADLARTVPDLSFSSLGAPGLSNLEIRGISSTTGTSTVAIYLDDAPITIRNNSFFAGQAEPQLFDLAQSEVLRGPQGTLYGASSMGGTIRFVSNRVNLNTFEATAGGELSGTEHGGLNYVAKGVVNIPLVADKVGLRVGVQTVWDSGFVDHATAGVIDRTNINGVRTNVVKAALQWDVTPRLTITPSVFAQKTDIHDTGLVDLATPNYVTSKLVQESGSDTLTVPSFKLNYAFGGADLISVTSYAQRRFPRITDGTYFNSVFIGDLVDSMGVTGVDGQLDGARLGALPGPVYNSLDTKQLTQEVRLVSKPYDPSRGNPFTWIVGLYYSDAKNDGASNQYIPGFNQTFLSTYGVSPETVLGVPLPNDLIYAYTTRLDDKEYATFGELSYNPTPRLKFTAGLRYLYGSSAMNFLASGFFASTPSFTGKISAHATTPKFSATYDLSDDVTTYATIGKGVRLGGINSPVPASACASDLAAFGLQAAPVGYQPDSLWNYELGAKGRFFDHQVSVSAAAYDIKWDQIQIDVPLKTCGFDYTANVGRAESYGLEVEARWRVGSALTVGASGQYNHDTFTQGIEGLGIAKGDPVPGAPKWSLNLDADYERDLTDKLTGFIRANWQFTGPSHGTFVQTNPDYQRPAYNLAGASIGVTYATWDVSLFAKNLFDTEKVIQRPSDNYAPEGYTPTPRIIGIEANSRFGG
jgi:outer membrane receptor protein involved in Fe transport